MEPAPGLRIAELELCRRLGEGATGTVWLARDAGGGEVAIKIADRALLRDDTALKRFLREARLALQMRSEHVPRIHQHGVTNDGHPYLVMEVLTGETLEQRLEREGWLSLAEVVEVVRQIALALDEAHELGVVHRDVKPSNVFLASDGEAAVVKMLDFGMAKRTSSLDPSVVTAAGLAVGTPDYMSPEQLRMMDQVDGRADVWALGVVAYRALCGKLPFHADTFAGLCMAICVGRYEAPSRVDPRLPRTLDAWFARVLAVERDKRFGSAGEAARELASTAAVLAASPTGWRRTAAWLIGIILAGAAGALAAWLSG